MKNILFLGLFVFAFSFSFAQKEEFEDPIYSNSKERSKTNDSQMTSNFYIENDGVVYKSVYEVNGLSGSQIVEKLNLLLNNSPGISNIKYSDEGFTARIDGLVIDYRKFGGKLATAWYALNFPMFGNMKVQVKESKYRVIISEIEFIEPSPYFVYNLSSSATIDERTKFTNKGVILKGLQLVDSALLEKFQIILDKTKDDW